MASSGWSTPNNNNNNNGFDSCYPPPPPPTSSAIVTLRPGKKASGRRKRYPPVGPAGVWFEAQRQGKKGGYQALAASQQEQEEEGSTNPNASTVCSNPAWMAMEFQLERLTPNVSLPSLTVGQRYQRIRPNLPEQYMLLPELPRKWNMPPSLSLIVLVHSIACHHDDIWTVELHDDTGLALQAWMQPSFVQAEKQDPATATSRLFIRPGYVWRLENVSVMLRHHDEKENIASIDRMLLIGKQNVKQVWRPDDLKKMDTDLWMEKKAKFEQEWDERNTTVPDNMAHDNNRPDPRDLQRKASFQKQDEQEEEPDVEVERYREGSYSPRPPPPQDQEEVGDVGGPKIRSLWTSTCNQSMMSQQRPASQVRSNSTLQSPVGSKNYLPQAEEAGKVDVLEDLFGSQLLSQTQTSSTRQPSMVASQHPQHSTLASARQSQSATFQMRDGVLDCSAGSQSHPSGLGQIHSPAVMQQSSHASQHQVSVGFSQRQSVPASQQQEQAAATIPKTPFQQPPSQDSHRTIVTHSANNPYNNNIMEHQTRQQQAHSQNVHRNVVTHSAPKANNNNPYKINNNKRKGPRRVSLSQHPEATPNPMPRPFASQSTPGLSQQQMLDKENGAVQQSLPLQSSDFSSYAAPKPLTKPPQSSNSASSGRATTSNARATKEKPTNSQPEAAKQKASKSRPKKKQKKAQFEVSPLSKPNLSQLWTSSAILDGGDFLDLSSSEDEAENKMTTAMSQVQPKRPNVAPPATTTTNKPANSILQAAAMSGIDWIGLSDEDD